MVSNQSPKTSVFLGVFESMCIYFQRTKIASHLKPEPFLALCDSCPGNPSEPLGPEGKAHRWTGQFLWGGLMLRIWALTCPGWWWLEHDWIIFPYIENVIIPTDWEFQRGRYTTSVTVEASPNLSRISPVTRHPHRTSFKQDINQYPQSWLAEHVNFVTCQGCSKQIQCVC